MTLFPNIPLSLFQQPLCLKHNILTQIALWYHETNSVFLDKHVDGTRLSDGMWGELKNPHVNVSIKAIKDSDVMESLLNAMFKQSENLCQGS